MLEGPALLPQQKEGLVLRQAIGVQGEGELGLLEAVKKNKSGRCVLLVLRV